MTGVALLAVPPITVDFDYRYMLPALPFACFAAAMAWGRRPAETAEEPEPVEAPEAQPADA